MIAKEITALIVTNYNMMTGVLEYLSSVPSDQRELVLAHYDYTSEMAALLENRIVIKAPTKLIGQRAAQLLLDRMNEDAEAGKEEIIENEIFGL